MTHTEAGSGSSHTTSRSQAEALFAQFVARRGVELDLDFETFCREHAGFEDDLHALLVEWQGVHGILDRLCVSGTLGSRLKKKYGPTADVAVALLEGVGEMTAELDSGIAAKLAERVGSFGRYRLRGEVARGGMGAIFSVWDEDLRRSLAMKVMLPAEDGGIDRVERFLEEAQVTGQLDHPCIVPVHELGLDDAGRIFFTMRFIRGRNLTQIFDLVGARSEGWAVTRAIGVLLRVCEAMAYAHSRGVIHRDLKPANVMVGKFGEVYVMDWGLARVEGNQDRHDLRIQAGDATVTDVRTHRRELRDEDLDSPLLTMDGTVVGTPAYMSPEQARGELDKVDARSDVYSVGVILYQLLTGRRPYVPDTGKISARTLLARLIDGPPKPIHELNPQVSSELQAICEKAMSRDRERRYADMGRLADDLSAYVEGRVVKAYETGAFAEIKKWVRRNRFEAATLVVALVVVIGGMLAYSAAMTRKNTDLKLARDTAEENESIAKTKADEVLSLSALSDVDDLIRRADGLWPIDPENATSYETWLDDARRLLAGSGAQRTKLDEFRTRAREASEEERALDRREHPRAADLRRERSLAELARRELSDAGPHLDDAERAGLLAAIETGSARISALEAEVARPWRWRFDSTEDAWWHDQLSALSERLLEIGDPESGLISGFSQAHGLGIERRLERARSIQAESLDVAAARAAWERAVASIADRAECPQYGGLSMPETLGLLPIGRDRASGLHEFVDLLTGSAPERDTNGRLVLTEETGVVLVLIPGGSFWMGSQSVSASEPNFDPGARADESPIRTVTVSPFLLSKYELTQAQWERIAGRNPSEKRAGTRFQSWSISGLNPVEIVSWEECTLFLSRMNLTLPTEAQWEYACRAGTSTAWWTGEERESLEGAANIADRSGDRFSQVWVIDWAELDDGYAVHAPVGSFRPNDFGLHDMAGNVWEWCRDGYDTYRSWATDGDNEFFDSGGGYRVIRGGAFYFPESYARSARRYGNTPKLKLSFLGVRPAREL